MLDLDDVKRRMEASVASLKNEFAGLRAGRANTAMLEPVTVDAYGSKNALLNQVSNISVPETRMLTVTVWDGGLVQATEKAIRESGLGLNPQVEGNVIRVPVPELSARIDAKKCKVAGKYAEGGRVAVRNVRRDAMKTVKKDEKEGGMSEDERRARESQIQKLTDQHIENIDDMLAKGKRYP